MLGGFALATIILLAILCVILYKVCQFIEERQFLGGNNIFLRGERGQT